MALAGISPGLCPQFNFSPARVFGTLGSRTQHSPYASPKVESGESLAGNLTAKNLIAIADALGVDPHILI